MNTTANPVTPLREPEISDPRTRVLVALPSPVYRAILGFVPLAVLRLMAERRVVLVRDEPKEEPPASFEQWVLNLEDLASYSFEGWLLARWLRDIRSDEFRGSVQGQRLMAEWERGR